MYFKSFFTLDYIKWIFNISYVHIVVYFRTVFAQLHLMYLVIYASLYSWYYSLKITL